MRRKRMKHLPGAAEHPRVRNWETALHEFAGSVVGTPFVLGETNCSILAARAVDAMYGTSFWSEFRDLAITDETELEQSAERTTRAQFAAHGFAVVPKNFEQTGDILIGWLDPFERCAVCLGGGRCLTSSRERGVCIISVPLFTRAYNAEVFRWV